MTTAEMKASNDFEIKELQYMCVASPAPPPPFMFDCFFYPFFFFLGGSLVPLLTTPLTLTQNRTQHRTLTPSTCYLHLTLNRIVVVVQRYPAETKLFKVMETRNDALRVRFSVINYRVEEGTSKLLFREGLSL